MAANAVVEIKSLSPEITKCYKITFNFTFYNFFTSLLIFFFHKLIKSNQLSRSLREKETYMYFFPAYFYNTIATLSILSK